LERRRQRVVGDALASDLASVSSPAAASPCIDGTYAPGLRILLVDDHTMLRSGLKAVLSVEFQGAAFGEAADGPGAFAQLHAQPWDIVLLDISLPGRSGLDLLKDLKAGWPRLRVLVLSGHKEDQLALRALRSGAEGYLSKASASDELVKAVQKIMAGGRYVSPALAEQLASEAAKDLARTPHQTLSDREYEVTCLLASGKTVTEIADELALSVKTISTYRARILEKLSVRNNAEVVQYAVRNGLVDC
jgi:DNA-binding NarL/FixJ family response regulator